MGFSFTSPLPGIASMVSESGDMSCRIERQVEGTTHLWIPGASDWPDRTGTVDLVFSRAQWALVAPNIIAVDATAMHLVNTDGQAVADGSGIQLDWDQDWTAWTMVRGFDVGGGGVALNVGLYDNREGAVSNGIGVFCFTVGNTLLVGVRDGPDSVTSSVLRGDITRQGDELVLVCFVYDSVSNLIRIVYVSSTETVSSQTSTSALGSFANTSDLVIGDSYSTTAFEGNMIAVSLVQSAMSDEECLALFDTLTMEGRIEDSVIDTRYDGVNNANQGVCQLADRRHTISGLLSGADGWMRTVSEDWLTDEIAVRVVDDTAFTGFTGHPSGHIGGIDFGLDGFVWGCVGAVPTVAWLFRVDPDDLVVDLALDLNDLLGTDYSSIDPVCYAEQLDTDHHVVLCASPARIFLLDIVSGVPTERARYGLTLVQGAHIEWGFPQGIFRIPGTGDTPETSQYLLGLYATGGWAGPVDGWWIVKIDSTGELRPVGGFASPELPAGLHVEDTSKVDLDVNRIAFTHAEGSRVANYAFNLPPHMLIIDYINNSTNGTVSNAWPLEWNGMDVVGELDLMPEGTPTFDPTEIPNSRQFGSTRLDQSGPEQYWFTSGPITVNTKNSWWIILMFRDAEGNGIAGWRNNPGGGTLQVRLQVRSNELSWEIDDGPNNFRLNTGAPVKDDTWWLAMGQYIAPSEPGGVSTMRACVMNANETFEAEMPAQITPFDHIGPMGFGTVFGTGVSEMDGYMWFPLVGPGVMTTENARRIFNLAVG